MDYMGEIWSNLEGAVFLCRTECDKCEHRRVCLGFVIDEEETSLYAYYCLDCLDEFIETAEELTDES